MSAIAIPQSQILLPLLRFPAWVKKIGEPLRMGQIGAGGIYRGLNAGAVGIAQLNTPHGWWDNNGAILGCVAAYQPKGAASLAASYVNLNNPSTNDAATGVAPTHATLTGWTFNGTTQYLTTGIVPVNNQTWSAIARFSNASGSGGVIVGASDAGQTYLFILQPRRAAATAVGYFSGGQLAITPALASGVIAFGGNKAYRNGTAETGTIPTGAAGTYPALLIGALNLGGTPSLFFVGDMYALAIYNTTISAAEAATLTTAINAL